MPPLNELYREFRVVPGLAEVGVLLPNDNELKKL